MKRSPIERRTPLKRTGRLASVGQRKARTLTAERQFRQQVRINAGGLCQIHSPACPPGRHEGHHAHHLCTADRRSGVHDPARGLLACDAGHRYLHANPAEAYAAGWLLRSGGAA